MTQKKKTGGGSGKAATPSAEKQNAELLAVENLAEEKKVPDWELAALRQATGWAPGKQVSASEFAEALTRFRSRPQGGGRI